MIKWTYMTDDNKDKFNTQYFISLHKLENAYVYTFVCVWVQINI